MKEVLFSLCAIFMVACSSDDLQVEGIDDSAQNASGITTVLVNGNEVVKGTRSSGEGDLALSFKDYSSLNKFEERLAKMSDQEKMEMVKKFGVSSLHELQQTADDELEEIGNNSRTEDEFRLSYNQYLRKYEGLLISNYMDGSDLNLYVPDGDNIKSFISNQNQIYVVGDKVIKADLKEQLPRVATQLLSVNTNSLPTNSAVFSPKSGKRVYLETYLINTRSHVKMHCRKKMWYGWKNDPSRSYYFDSFITSDFVYLSQGQYGQEIASPRLPRYIFNNNVKDGFDIILGKINGGSSVVGKIYAWTDMTSEYDASGKDVTETINGMIVPKCLQSKAHVINVKLEVK